ncbi:alpha/beta-hydrolase [Coprinellus micaceus]|uniref:sn-1-specific diacylglycerol lipase n=1 Tax=Coprinellus micaceus TaxID=71717 RepID=A0A4Y7T6F5_COPMI|nr:alpha/beta-hydrolase [Coprinellus micaceus]
MARHWDSYTRHGLDVALGVSSVGFHVAKAGTRFGFSIAKGIASAAAGVTSFAVDQTVFGGNSVTRPLLQGAVSTVFNVAEQFTLAPIYLGEYITSTSVLAAHSTINALSVIFPGSNEASFSLVAFIDLVRREWRQAEDPQRPEKHYGLTKVAWAIVGWVSLQGVTQEWQEKRWLKHLKEIDVNAVRPTPLSRKPSRVRVTSDIILPGEGGAQIITASIGEETPPSRRLSLRRSRSRASIISTFSLTSSLAPLDEDPNWLPDPELKSNFRRLSKLVLAGYGGASLLFFGVSPSQLYPSEPSKKTSLETEKQKEEAKLATAIDAAEAEAAGVPSLDPSEHKYSWWEILIGKHDQEIFEKDSSSLKATAVIGNQHLMPRFWVLTDYAREEVVLVIRGTMSLNEIAADLTCEPDWFEPARTPPPSQLDENSAIPGFLKFPSKPTMSDHPPRAPGTRYHVHGGMLRLAKAMGDVGNPVQVAVMEALYTNPGFDLVLCGHSLGAGVATLLGMIWADPATCLTVPSGGLPVGRHVQVYCFAPPALTDASLSRLADKLVHSFVYSNDIVSRLSLGSIRDLRNTAMWLCEANEAQEGKSTGEGYSAISERARKWKAGKGSPGDMEWFVAMRKTLEANMQNCDMYPPGRVFWAIRDSDFHPTHRRCKGQQQGEHSSSGSTVEGGEADKLRLFEVLDVKEVFSQVVFAQNMLSSHMPHQYDNILHELL